MDYEKKYKDALERAKEFYILCKKCGAKDTVDFLEDTFPELCESEDEKMRQEIIKVFKTLGDRKIPVDINYADIFTWLERQGEQKPIKMWHDISEVPDEMQELLVEWESPDATWHDIAFYDAETKAFRHLKQPINNVTRWAYVSDILSQSVTKTSEQGWGDAVEKQGEQKPAWSEDDEKRLQSCINILKAKSLMGKVDTANTMWLKSLKQRIGGKL